MHTIKIVNVTTGEEIEREMNADELAQQVIDQVAEAARKADQATKANEKAALLAKLGLTADEAALLLGGN
jgi:acyl-CoA reductase-like NAD-dependent aldehyde dehydrogenase